MNSETEKEMYKPQVSYEMCGDKVFLIIPQNHYNERRLVMTKDLFRACYEHWVKKAEDSTEDLIGNNMNDLVSRQVAVDALNEVINEFEQLLRSIRESKVDDSVCGMCEYDGAYVGQSGNWCNDCPGFDEDDCFKLSDKCRKRWLESVELPSVEKTGKWVMNERGVYECSVCGRVPTEEQKQYDQYCSNCGARMLE